MASEATVGPSTALPETYVSREARAALFGCAQQVDDVEAAVTGTFPSWINGSILMNGGANYTGMQHLFDGYAMLCKIRFIQGRVYGSQKYLQSKAYRHFEDTQSMRYMEFGTPLGNGLPPLQRLLKTLTLLFTEGIDGFSTDNASVNVIPLPTGSVLAVSEAVASTYHADPETLATGSQVKYDDAVPGQLTTAHPKMLEDGTIISFTRSFPFGGFHVYRQDPVTLKRTQIAFIRDWDPLSPCWVHDVAASRDHLVIVENPAFMRLTPLLTGSVESCLDWKPELGSRVHVVPLRPGAGEVRTYPAPAFFSLHNANAFEQDGCIHVDLNVYEDTDILKALLLDRIREYPGRDIPSSGLRRLSIPLSGGTSTLPSPQSLAPDESRHGDFFEFPCINPLRSGQKHRYVWGNGAVRPTNLSNALVKIDVDSGNVITWHEDGALPGGPVFVAAPEGSEEDQGVILSVVMSAAGTSFVLALDAANMTELGRASLSYAAPYRFHGTFLQGCA